jgi:hypothetical protein
VDDVATLFRHYGPAYRAKFGRQMLPSHRRTMADIEQCRTERMGGHVYACPDCGDFRYRYHSCQNRHCPQCQQRAGEEWLAKQHKLLLPVPYFLLTFTLPDGLRRLARSHQKLVYNLLFRASAAATQELAQDPRFVGGQIGMVGVLQTWTRDLIFHPHVHYLVPGGGLSPTGEWVRARNHFLVHVKPLSILFRAKFRDELRKTPLFDQLPASIWRQDWVVHSQPVGNGHAALKYLAPYIFRVAISNRRILKVADGQVTFVYKDRRRGKRRRCTLPAQEFIRRFLQHVLPTGFVKVRYYGLFSPGHRHLLQQVQQLLDIPVEPTSTRSPKSTPAASTLSCPTCGSPMHLVQIFRPKSRSPP